MKNYYSHLIVFGKRIVLLLFLFAITRLYFLLYNHADFSGISFWESCVVLFSGVRFDVFVIAWANVALIVGMTIPGKFKNNALYQKIIKIAFVVINSILLFANIADADFFAFTKKRTSAYIFELTGFGDMQADGIRLLPTFLVDFWHVFLIMIVIAFGLWKLYPKQKNQAKVSTFSYKTLVFQSAIFLFIMFWWVIAARGGFQLRPITMVNASDHAPPQYATLVLNTPFTIIRTMDKEGLKPLSYYDAETLEKHYNPCFEVTPSTIDGIENVVLIVLESFGNEYIGFFNEGEGYTPFLDKLLAKSLVFPNAFANGTQSIESLPSIVAGIPSLMPTPYITSLYATNTIHSLPWELKKSGYTSMFFHGATNGSLGLTSFAKIAGFDSYYGRTEYNNDKDYDGKWGIFDEEFLQAMAKELNLLQKPFFATVLTLSAHHPYTLPKKHIGRFQDEVHPITKVVRYSDYALERFFETVSKFDWYSSTLFIITADHTGPVINEAYRSSTGRYAIPIAYYAPGNDSLISINQRITQHADIFPSTMALLGKQTKILSFGNNVFDDSKDGFAISYHNGTYQLISDSLVFWFDGEKPTAIYNHKNDPLLTQNLLSSLGITTGIEAFTKAYIQQYNNRLINNRVVCE